MRGGSQAHLFQCGEGLFYVVKFSNNPQHRRILVNEWIASVVLNYLQLSIPPAAIVNVSAEFLAANPDVYIQLGSRRQCIDPGPHFGSRYPGDPGKEIVYDFLPDSLLEKVVNAAEFPGILAFDKWMCNADARQSIFYRIRSPQGPQCTDHKPFASGLVAKMIDNGYVFNGPHWNLPDSPLHGLYCRPSVYKEVRGWNDFQPWLDRVVHFPRAVLDQSLEQLPSEWLAEDGAALKVLIEKLLLRRCRVVDLISDSRSRGVNLFPAWT